jgi:hypothetical protein
VVLLYLSLNHLANGVRIVTGCEPWEATAMAIGLAHEMEVDCRLAARALSNFTTLRFRVGEIAEAALAQSGAAIRRDLIAALAHTEF